ncbi:aldehyde dehydrogenase family protein [Saccharomonospora xinjiangensis]|uniref:aldehyde dehydrogenase family protein n=1 Tax=Saccharomonospora xinjiangensis TaxID=75294 RepID=UPI00106F9017|nr:aldehyde dehydrogenase family protein [Saccharomonospora xinjiangensis]QBQ60267.1 Succinate-semialdehyde dehydrogenase [NADP(+)] GabD [Saccharomonospora xinjiangensis]
MTDLAVEPDLPPAESADGRSIRIHNPADGTLVGDVAMATREETASAVAAARAVFPAWAATPAEERAAALRSAADALADRADDLAEINEAETGRPAAQAREGVLAGVATLRQYAELGPLHRGRTLLGQQSATDLMVPEPRGVVVVLTPWNDPVAVACGLVGAALVTGNTVVAKPSERCPHTGALLGEVLRPHFPENVVRHLAGDGTVGSWLAGHEDVDVIAHVGSTDTGRSLAEAAARTGAKALLENGGNDPLVIDGDVDPEWAAEQAATGAFANSGQICVAVERIFVHRAVAEPFVTALTAAAERAGLLPLVDLRHRKAVHEHVAQAVEAGARLRAGGVVSDGPGSLYPATVLTGCDPAMRVMREETFGPVAPVCVVDEFAEGLALARDDAYGLAATVLTRSMAHAQQAWRALPVGTVKVNAVFGGAPGGAAHPRGASGHGYGYGPELLDELTATKVVHVEPAP